MGGDDVRRNALVAGAVFAMLVGGVASVDGQTRSWKDVQVEDIEQMGDKFAQLAEAFDESQYDWRPMEGVHSVREVLGLAIAEAHLFPPGRARGPEVGERP